jgi:hypothetical protein
MHSLIDNTCKLISSIIIFTFIAPFTPTTRHEHRNSCQPVVRMCHSKTYIRFDFIYIHFKKLVYIMKSDPHETEFVLRKKSYSQLFIWGYTYCHCCIRRALSITEAGKTNSIIINFGHLLICYGSQTLG